MSTVEEDYVRPLQEVYESLPKDTREVLSSDIRKIWTYFFVWFVSIVISILGIVWFIECELIDEPLGERLQRVGSVVPVLVAIVEISCIVKLTRLTSVTHPAKLTYQIYKHRRYKLLAQISQWVTFLVICLSAIFSGYGDLLF